MRNWKNSIVSGIGSITVAASAVSFALAFAGNPWIAVGVLFVALFAVVDATVRYARRRVPGTTYLLALSILTTILLACAPQTLQLASSAWSNDGSASTNEVDTDTVAESFPHLLTALEDLQEQAAALNQKNREILESYRDDPYGSAFSFVSLSHMFSYSEDVIDFVLYNNDKLRNFTIGNLFIKSNNTHLYIIPDIRLAPNGSYYRQMLVNKRGVFEFCFNAIRSDGIIIGHNYRVSAVIQSRASTFDFLSHEITFQEITCK